MKKDLREVVPDKFYKGIEHTTPDKFYKSIEHVPQTKTVGGLIALLQELPATLRLDVSYVVSVTNIESRNPGW